VIYKLHVTSHKTLTMGDVLTSQVT